MSVTLHTTHGDIKCELYCEQAPKTCKNFLALAAKGYYNGTQFHRNIKGFIVQGGDATGTGKGGESIYGGAFEDEFDETLKHDKRGLLSMANMGPNTNLSQFFFTYGPQPQLDGKYTIFGRIIEGHDALDKMENEPVGKQYRPLNEVAVKYITIHANPIADQEAGPPPK